MTGTPRHAGALQCSREWPSKGHPRAHSHLRLWLVRRTPSTRATPIIAARQPDCSEDSLTDDGVVIQILMENGLHGLQSGTGTGQDSCDAAVVAIVVDDPDHILVCRTVLPRHLVTVGGLFRSERRPGPELAGDDV